MAVYYINKNSQSTGEHEVHKDNCSYLPEPSNRQYLGEYSNCKDAVKKAKDYYDNVDGCYHCTDCHTR